MLQPPTSAVAEPDHTRHEAGRATVSGVGDEAPTPDEVNLVANLFKAGRYDEIEPLARDLTRRFPRHALGWMVLAAVLKQTERVEESLAPQQEAVALLPGKAEPLSNLGNAFLHLGRLTEAEACYRKALTLQPNFADGHHNLGCALSAQGRLAEAEASFRSALALQPNLAEAHHRLGTVLDSQGRLAEAEASHLRALSIQPALAAAHDSLGNVLLQSRRLEEAAARCRRAVELAPKLPNLHSNLLFTLNYLGENAAGDRLECARSYGTLVTTRAAKAFSSWPCDSQPSRLRVGLLSGDLRRHSVGLFVESVVAHLDPQRIELVAYPTNALEDDLTARIRPRFAHWRPLTGMSDATAARLIHADGLHILVDLAGHTGHNRLPVFAWRPAPVQLTWLGYLATTGMTEIDYVLSDPYASPGGDEANFTETVWRLPETALCFSPPATGVVPGPLPATESGRVTFGSFNNLVKINDTVIAVWARVLHAVPQSQLYLKSMHFREAAVEASTRRRFAALGIDEDRLLLSGMQETTAEHLTEYRRVDIALDTFPYPGVTTSIEALWMGVPVLTRRSAGALLRAGESIARNAGMVDWIAVDDDDYVAKAVRFAADTDSLAELRADLRDRVLASPLFDRPRFARNLEAALWEMWRCRRDRFLAAQSYI